MIWAMAFPGVAASQTSTLEKMHRERIDAFEAGRRDGRVSEEEADYLLRVAPMLVEYEEERARMRTAKHARAGASGNARRRQGGILSFLEGSLEADGEGFGTINLRYMAEVLPPHTREHNEAVKSLREISRKRERPRQGVVCEACQVPCLIVPDEGSIVCPECGTCQDDLECGRSGLTYEQEANRNIVPSFLYKRAVHLLEWLARILGKESTVIPDDVIAKVRAEFKKCRITSTDEITPKRVRGFLKKLDLLQYHEHSVSICRILGVEPPSVPPEVEEKIVIMFAAAQEPFKRPAPPDRSNFLSYAYTLYKFFELLGQDHILPYLQLLKSRQKMRVHDKVWRKICADLQWQFIPSETD
jgi:hypothetical protein